MLAALDLPSGDGLGDELYAQFTDLRNYALFDDVRPALAALAVTEATLGIVSNFEAWLEDLLRALDVRDAFTVRVISGLEGIEKPDPRIYQRGPRARRRAAERCRVRGGQPGVRRRAAGRDRA